MGHNHNTLITKYQYNIRILTIYENNKKNIYSSSFIYYTISAKLYQIKQQIATNKDVKKIIQNIH